MNPRHGLFPAMPIALVVLAAAGPRAQQTSHVIVPAAWSGRDAPGWGDLPGLHERSRGQVLLASSRVAALRGRAILEIWWRRDSGLDEALAGGQARLVVEASSGGPEPGDAAPDLDRNRGKNPTEVFRGVLAIPASPRLPPGGNADWGPANTLRLRLTRPYVVSSGPLCLEIRGEPVAGRTTPWWPVDFDFDDHPGTVATFGQSCFVAGRRNGSSASVPEHTLRVGATARLRAFGLPDTLAFAALGVQAVPGGVSLAPLGAKGCHLYLRPMATVASRFDPVRSGVLGYAGVDLQLPNRTSLLGASFLAQWIALEHSLPRSQWTNPAGITTSEGQRLTISPTAPRLGAAYVQSVGVPPGRPFPSTGTVFQVKAPVLRFVLR